MLKLQKQTELAIIALHHMHLGTRTNTSTLAAMIGAKENTLHKVLQRLVKAELLTSERGPSGGFQLCRPINLISLRHVVEAMEPAPEDTCGLHEVVERSCALCRARRAYWLEIRSHSVAAVRIQKGVPCD